MLEAMTKLGKYETVFNTHPQCPITITEIDNKIHQNKNNDFQEPVKLFTTKSFLVLNLHTKFE